MPPEIQSPFLLVASSVHRSRPNTQYPFVDSSRDIELTAVSQSLSESLERESVLSTTRSNSHELLVTTVGFAPPESAEQSS